MTHGKIFLIGNRQFIAVHFADLEFVVWDLKDNAVKSLLLGQY